ncbi:Lipocalin-like domain-containing protein [Triangularia verruculosa]|uniref:Lipocalin-like domain-containing protein n=1 Tax=Triangularia verruculosa TaxID=2587418 RepID=A0AAN6X7C5_9PEZI|nr:Lipocalin-like domain-containing protein [Triangularia verruculosa]
MKTQEIINFLAGTYSLLNNTQWRNGTQVPDPWGKNPAGLLTYTRYGYMSAVMNSMEPEKRPSNLTWPPNEQGNVEDWALIAKSSLSYSGPFSLNTSVPLTKYSGQVLHGPVVTGSMPSMVGVVQRRNYTVVERDGEVYLSIAVITTQVGARSEIWWRRVAKG